MAAALHIDWLDLGDVQLIGIVGTTVAGLESVSDDILVLATPATVQSNVYQDVFKLHGKEVDVQPLPKLAALI